MVVTICCPRLRRDADIASLESAALRIHKLASATPGGAELTAVAGRDAFLQAGSADRLARCLFPPTRVLEWRASDGNA